MNDDDILDYIEDSRNYRALGTDLEFDYDDNDMLVLKPYVEPSLLENIGGGLQRVGAALVGTGAGAVGATLGLPTDLVGLINGIKDAVSAEDGKKLDAFSRGFSEFSKGGIIPGSEFYKDAWDKTVDSLETYSPEMKEDAKAAFTLGEFIGLEQTAVKGAKAIPKITKSIKPKLQEMGEAAQKRVDENQGSMTMSSMGVGEMGKMVDKGLSKLAPNKGEVVNLKPKTDRLNFYSKAEEVTNQLKQNKGTGQQYRQQLLKAGVKPDEIEWLGLDDVLNKGKITKQEIQDQINANRIELDEVELSGNSDDILGGLASRFNESERPMSADDAYGPEYLNNRADEIFEDYELNDGDTTKFTIDDAYEQAKNEYDDNPIMKYVDPETGYTIAGNDDVGYSIFRSEAESSNFRNAINSTDTPYSLNEAVIRAREDIMEGDMMPGEGTRFEEYTEPGGDNYREFLIKYNDPKVQFDESHFDELNVIAHFRTKDRTTSDGKKVFYIEEIQSDWGQKFRSQLSEERAARMGIQDEGYEMYKKRHGAPKAPFITDTDKWTQLTLKRILSKAVDEGYDFVSLTPGKAQMDRWNDEGVAKFYDEIVPKNAEKIVKKLDKNAIQKDKLIKFQKTFESSPPLDQNATRFSIELTPQLKEKVKKGMAMFSATPLVIGQENE